MVSVAVAFGLRGFCSFGFLVVSVAFAISGFCDFLFFLVFDSLSDAGLVLFLMVAFGFCRFCWISWPLFITCFVGISLAFCSFLVVWH